MPEIKTIAITLTGKTYGDMILLSGEAKMRVEQLAEIILDSYTLEHRPNWCPECKHEYRGTICGCKKSDLL